jgi:hypothetical protein
LNLHAPRRSPGGQGEHPYDCCSNQRPHFSSLASRRSVAAIMPGHAYPNAYGAGDIGMMRSETSVASSDVNSTAGGDHGPELVRGLNVWHAISIVAGTIIGSGIFLVPA